MARKADCDRCGEAEAVSKELDESEGDVLWEHPQPGIGVRYVVAPQKGHPGGNSGLLAKEPVMGSRSEILGIG
jgi:hypothetical protein